MKSEEGARAVATTLGYINGIHTKLHQIREGQSEEDVRDLDSAQVFLESAHQKLAEVLNRHQPTIDPTRITKSEED